MTLFDALGLVGVALILVAYAASTTGRLDPKGAPSLAVNFVGSGLILLSLMTKFNLSAAIVEGAWSLIALVGLGRVALRRLRKA
ncbi:MAG TPA: hypothetical protein VHW60_15355 [Caulobacteraceae bacterium]|nr:hypothetical protein [Caulobacteraceae bacterium]